MQKDRLFLQNNWLHFIRQKSSNKRLLKKFLFKKKSKITVKYFYKTLRIRPNRVFWPLVHYQMFKYINRRFTSSFVQRKFFFFLEIYNNENKNFVIKANKLYNKYLQQKFSFFFNFFFFYNAYLLYLKINSLHFIKKLKKKSIFYNLIFTFKKNKFFVNFHDKLKRNYLFLSSGFFIKNFEKKKLYKKSKIIRILMYKYLRKVFLLIKIPNTIVTLKKNPIFLLEFLNIFHQEIPHKFREPLTLREISDSNDKLLTNITYFIFLNNKSYVKFKQKKKGRVKRKIFRKIVLRNNITD